MLPIKYKIEALKRAKIKTGQQRSEMTAHLLSRIPGSVIYTYTTTKPIR